mgnify:CR=1 FL=1
MTMAMPPKGAVDLVLLLVMWWIMMIGMMLPSAAPMILTFANINRGRRARRQPYTPTVLFTSGYTPEAVSRKGIAIPAEQFMQKPYSPAGLCRKIRDILDR